jgi:serine/threonine protein phosphatase PrpC
MLNDADGHGGGDAGEAVKDADALFTRLKSQVKADYNSKGQVNWRREAREDFDFEAGEQLNDEDKAILQDAKRPIVIFNRVGMTVDCVAGQGSRQPAGSAVLQHR